MPAALTGRWRLMEINDHRRHLTSLSRNRTPALAIVRPSLHVKPKWSAKIDSTGRRVDFASLPVDSSENEHYIPGSDPKAEEAAETILSLPTHPTMSEQQARTLCGILRNLLTEADRMR